MNPTIVPTYESIVRAQVVPKGATPEADGKMLAHAMYRTSLAHISKGLAIYRDLESDHDPLLVKHTGAKLVQACFCPRPGKLPPRETWIAAISEFSPPGREQPFYVIDNLKTLLPDFDNFGDKLLLAEAALSWLKSAYAGKDLVYPNAATEKSLSKYTCDYAVSKYAVRKAARGTLTLRLDNTFPTKTYGFYRL